MNKMESDKFSTKDSVRVKQPRRALSPRVLLIGVLVVLAGGYLVYVHPFGGGVAGPGGAGGFNRGMMAAPPVHVATAKISDVPVEERTIGTVLANATVQVKSQIDGQVLSAAFQEGQMVKAGELLFQIDPKPYQASLRQAQAQLQRDSAQAASAESEAERATSLAQRGIVSTQQKEQSTATAQALAASVAADKAAVDRAQLQLGYTEIRSPIDGKTGPILVHPGNLIKANDANPLVVINQVQPVKISFSLPQSDLPVLQDRMRSGDLVAALTVRTDANASVAPADNGEIDVKVDFIGNVVDARTGTIELRATSDNPDLRLVPGELVDVRVKLNTLHNVASVPVQAINVGPDGNYVFVVDDNNVAQMRPVKVAFQNDTTAAISQGLKGGERVITEGQLRVTPGSTVNIVGEPGSRSPQQGAVGAAGEAQGQGGVEERDGGSQLNGQRPDGTAGDRGAQQQGPTRSQAAGVTGVLRGERRAD